MRYPEGHKEAVHARIVDEAAAAFRERGIDGVSIPELMKQVGLTHGGFYSHFENRDALLSEAIEAAGQQTAERVFGPDHSLAQALEHYLSPGHLDHPEVGCVVATLATEGARPSSTVRTTIARVARGLIELVDKKMRPKKRGGALSDQALLVTATMVGAVVLGRALDDPDLVGRLLRLARESAQPRG